MDVRFLFLVPGKRANHISIRSNWQPRVRMTASLLYSRWREEGERALTQISKRYEISGTTQVWGARERWWSSSHRTKKRIKMKHTEEG
jgi:hypothetical protein